MSSCAPQQARIGFNRAHAPAQALQPRKGLFRSLVRRQLLIGGRGGALGFAFSTSTAAPSSSASALAAMPRQQPTPETLLLYTPAKGTTLADFVLEATGAARPPPPAQLSSEEASLLVAALERSTRRVAAALSRAGIDDRLGRAKGEEGSGTSSAANAAAEPSSSERDAPKELDIVANEILKEELAKTGVVGLLASEEDEEVVVVGEKDGETSLPFVAVFDPLDGSSNIAACIPTGTIFGIYRRGRNSNAKANANAGAKAKANANANANASGGGGGRGGGNAEGGDEAGKSALEREALRPGRELLLAGYSLYSSATMLVLTLSGGDEAAGTHGFTLDPSSGSFVCTHPRIRVPERGQFYSLNDARFDDWSPALRRYVTAVRAGRGESGKQYAARYVCSLVADLHRTLLYGGWAGNPRGHLRRAYEAAPLGALTEAAGGRATDGEAASVLDVAPGALHSRAPFFAGSRLDIAELLSYGDVRQVGKKKYDV